MSSSDWGYGPVRAPFNPKIYNEFRKSILEISNEYWLAIDDGSILILPPKGKTMRDNDPVLKVMGKFCSVLGLVAESDWDWCLKEGHPAEAIEQATAEWAFLNGAEGIRQQRRGMEPFGMKWYAERYPEWAAEHANDPGEFDEHDR